ncbi:protein HOTHEAD isoform X2 [Canna indica]|uniref:Protein HOTHEAD isoform X2 n=1 Tax=Canna indica TaxID=4628 RepID=A0AAQ3QAE1_9LILI|nr:protein HOTHEAD isoform X2 [Canna indica]
MATPSLLALLLSSLLTQEKYYSLLLPVHFPMLSRLLLRRSKPLLGTLFAQPFASPNYTFLEHAVEAPLVSYHDNIIGGGGTAGCPLAATLSKTFNVLVLERGGSPYDNAKRIISCFFDLLLPTYLLFLLTRCLSSQLIGAL